MKKNLFVTLMLLSMTVLPVRAYDIYVGYLVDSMYYYLEEWQQLIDGVDVNVPVASLAMGEPLRFKRVDTVSVNSSVPERVTPQGNRQNKSSYDYIANGGYYRGDITVPATITVNDTVWSVKYLDYRAFYRSADLTSVTLPATLERISDRAFEGCPLLTEMEMPAGLKRLGGYAFSGTGIKEVFLPDSMVYLGARYTAGINVYVSDNQVTYERGFAPQFATGCGYPKYAHEKGVFVYPKSRFLVCEQPAYYDYGVRTVVIPDVESFGAVKGSFSNQSVRNFVCMAPVPPVIEPYSYLYYADPSNMSSREIESAMLDYNRYPLEDGLMDDYAGVTLVVPRGSEELYRNAPVWKNFTIIKGVDSFDEYLDKPSSISGPEADDAHGDAEYFNINGARVGAGNLAPGNYIRRQGAKTEKIRVR